MRIRLSTPVLLVATLACASSAAAATPIAHPTGATALVLRVTSDGGFVAPGTILGAVPAFSLYGDGTVIVPGAVPQIYPGPAISPLRRSRLAERQVQALLRRAKAAGLLARRGRIDYGDIGTIGVADAPTTTLRVRSRAGRSCGRPMPSVSRPAAIACPGAGRGPSCARAVHPRAPARPEGRGLAPRALAVYVSAYGGQAKPGERREDMAARERPRDGREAAVQRIVVPLPHGRRDAGAQPARGARARERADALAGARLGSVHADRAPAAARRARLLVALALEVGCRGRLGPRRVARRVVSGQRVRGHPVLALPARNRRLGALAGHEARALDRAASGARSACSWGRRASSAPARSGARPDTRRAAGRRRSPRRSPSAAAGARARGR